MLRVLLTVGLVMGLEGCASGGDPTDRVGGELGKENIGHGAQALGAAWEGDASTRSPVSDNTQLSFVSSIGRPGVVPDADAGFCWITALSGSFRGDGEYARIVNNSAGYYEADIKSVPLYDSLTGAGPAIAIRCRHLTDFIDAAHVRDFSSRTTSVSGNSSPDAGTNFGQGTSGLVSGSMYPWAAVEGRLGDAGNATWMLAAVDHGSDTVFARWAQACPYFPPTYPPSSCSMLSGAWEISSATHIWTYSVTNASASNNADVVLTAASGQECYLDGVWGYWTATSSAKVETQGDGNWHLVTAKGTGALGMGAYASCFPLSQGF